MNPPDFQVILLTACPCAIVIGPPLATTCAIAAAAARGLLIKKPDTVELLQLGWEGYTVTIW